MVLIPSRRLSRRVTGDKSPAWKAPLDTHYSSKSEGSRNHEMLLRLSYRRPRGLATIVLGCCRRGGRGPGCVGLCAAGHRRAVAEEPQADPDHLLARRCEPTRELGSEAEHRHRRTDPRDSDERARVHISELLPYTAKQMHRLTLVRGINTRTATTARGTSKCSPVARKTPAKIIRTWVLWLPSCSRQTSLPCLVTSLSRVAVAVSQVRRILGEVSLRCRSMAPSRRNMPSASRGNDRRGRHASQQVPPIGQRSLRRSSSQC